MEPDTNKIKHDFICSLLEEGDAMICLDAREPGVIVPREHQGNHSLNLVLNLNFPRPMEIKEEGILATLSFGGRPFTCVVPMQAIWAAFNPATGMGQIWQGSVPEEVLRKLGKTKDLSSAAEAPMPDKTPLKLVPNQSTQKSSGLDPAHPARKKGKQKGHLRVIK